VRSEWPTPADAVAAGPMVQTGTMEPPKELEGHRFVGDKRSQVVYDLENCDTPELIEDIVAAKAYATFGPDELREARNRGYRPSKRTSA